LPPAASDDALSLQSNRLATLYAPYKGTYTANLDLIAGRTGFGSLDTATVSPTVKEKRVRGLEITSLKRFPLLPDVPTSAETVPGCEFVNWHVVKDLVKSPRTVVQQRDRQSIATSRHDIPTRGNLHAVVGPLCRGSMILI